MLHFGGRGERTGMSMNFTYFLKNWYFRETDRNIIFLFTYSCFHWLLLVCALMRGGTTTLAYQDDTPAT